MKKDKMMDVSEEDVQWKVSVSIRKGKKSDGEVPSQLWLNDYLFIIALLPVQLQPKMRSASSWMMF